MKAVIILSVVIFISLSTGYAQNCDPPGEMVGITEYYVQAFGASSQRIGLDSAGGVHFTWTRGVSPNRNVYYNFRHEDGTWLGPGGTPVSQYAGAGFSSMGLLPGGEAVIAYHNISGGQYIMISVDFYRI
jgi:hypothetical protein